MSVSCIAALIAALALALPIQAQAAAQPLSPQSPADAVYPLLDRIFRAEMQQEQLASLGPEVGLEHVAEALLPDQRSAALLALRRLEPTANPADLKQIKRGYELLGMWDEALRLEAFPPKVQDAAIAEASTALSQGDKEKAALLASDILARDPLNEKANALLQLSKRYVPEAELEQIKLNPTAPQDVKVLGYMLQASGARGDHDKLMRLALDAMRADPTSPLAHEFYNNVTKTRAEHLQNLRQSYSYVQESKRALSRGDKNTALVWAQKAADADPSPTARGYLESVRNAEMSKKATVAAQPIATLPKQSEESSPFWPLAGAAAAVLALGGGAVAFGDKAVMWSKEHPYLALGGVTVAALGAGWLVFGGGVAGGLTLITTNGARLVAAARAGTAAKPAVDGALTLLVAKGASDALSSSKADVRDRAVVQNGRPERLVRGNSDDPYKQAAQGPGVLPPLLPGPLPTSTKQNRCVLKPGEDILDRFVDRSRLATGFLWKHEGEQRGLGHTIERHVKKKPEYLRGRVQNEGLGEASTFFDHATTERIVREAITADTTAIAEWFSRGRLAPHDTRYTGNTASIIGNAVAANNLELLLPRYDAIIRLKRTPHCEIYILTAYPE